MIRLFNEVDSWCLFATIFVCMQTHDAQATLLLRSTIDSQFHVSRIVPVPRNVTISHIFQGACDYKRHLAAVVESDGGSGVGDAAADAAVRGVVCVDA